MTILTKALTTALILASTAITGSANAQSTKSSALFSMPVKNWVLKRASPEQNQTVFIKSDVEKVEKQFSPWLDRDEHLISRIDASPYSKFDISEFKYPLFGPVNLAVQTDYQELLTPNSALHAIDITYQAPDSSPYSQTPYQVAKTVTAQVKFTF